MAIILQHLRETANITQRELARRAGVTQETVSQLESGKSSRPRLDTLTKLRDALELDDLPPEDLLDPTPLDADPEITPAAERLVTLLKVLPGYDPRTGRGGEFWEPFSTHLGYLDQYPARKIAAHLRNTVDGSGRERGVDLAQYTLMFFDPEDRSALQLLSERGGIGPGEHVARLWCRDVTDAAWVIHRATLTSYPQQVGQLYLEADEAADPARIAELCQSVYAMVRARALRQAPPAEQIAALRDDPSPDVRYEIAKTAGHEVQRAAVGIPGAWTGLAKNPDLAPEVMRQLVSTVLAGLESEDGSPAQQTMFHLCERADLPRALAEKISRHIDREDAPDSSWITASVLAVQDRLDDVESEFGNSGSTRRSRPRLHPVDSGNERPGWWRRFLPHPRS